MNAKKLAAAAIMFAAASTAFAQSTEFVVPDADFVSSKTRADVMSELTQAQESGALSFREDTYPFQADQNAMQAGKEGHAGTNKSADTNRFDPSLYFG